MCQSDTFLIRNQEISESDTAADPKGLTFSEGKPDIWLILCKGKKSRNSPTILVTKNTKSSEDFVPQPTFFKPHNILRYLKLKRAMRSVCSACKWPSGCEIDSRFVNTHFKIQKGSEHPENAPFLCQASTLVVTNMSFEIRMVMPRHFFDPWPRALFTFETLSAMQPVFPDLPLSYSLCCTPGKFASRYKEKSTSHLFNIFP